uniref:Uncharacterized protein n=1 Tax=Anguilla anguilla TaxID=7936 RepID=A0A0E9Y171_ANGAN
MEKGRLVNVLV